MAAPMEENVLLAAEEKLCEIEATVVTGFESIAKIEAEEKLGVEVKISERRGKIMMSLPLSQVQKISQLQGIGNMYVVLKHYHHFPYADTVEGVLEQFKDIIPEIDWAHGLEVWTKFFSFPYPVSPKPQVQKDPDDQLPSSDTSQHSDTVHPVEKSDDHTEDSLEQNLNTNSDTLPQLTDSKSDSRTCECKSDTNVLKTPVSDNQAKETKGLHNVNENKVGPDSIPESTETEPAAKKPKKTVNPSLPAFRATCHRVGKSHIFQSPESACKFGGALQDYFGWNVDLKNYDIEVLLNIEDDHIYVTISLNKESLHKRHIKHFGPTVLKPTIAYNMLRMCDIKPGDVVCDPMCGGGSIPIEAALNWRLATHICGDIHDKAWPRAVGNIEAINEKRLATNRKPVHIDVFSWDVCRLPLKDRSVDVFITDMPFGKRSGNRMSNWHLYPRALEEMARVSKPQGRMCLLTHDKKCMHKTLNTVSRFWRRTQTLWVNIGGLAAGVYLLHRTSEPTS